MKKYLIVVVAGLFSTQAKAEVNPDLVNKYHWGNYYFDGNKVKNAHGSALNFDNAKKTVGGNLGANNLYKMTWGNEEIDSSDIFTLTEVRVTPLNSEKSDVYSRTSTFSKDKLRSSTLCYGNSAKGAVTKNSMKCVTATKRSCKRLMESYGQEAGKNSLLKNQESTAKAAQECISVLKSYENMAIAFANQSSQLESRHNGVVDSDTSRIKSLVDQTTGSKAWEPTNIGTLTKSSDLDQMAGNYAGSIEGMRALTGALQLCADAMNDFQEEGASSSGMRSPSKGQKTAQ